MAELKDFIYLSNEDYNTLVTTGTVTIAGEVLTYDPNNVYITPEKLATTTEDGLMSSTDKVKLDGLSAPSDATITIQKNGATAGTFTLNQASAGTVNIEVPTATSGLTNDSGFITKSVNNLDNYTKTSSLATVATSGSYNDLSNKPTIPDISGKEDASNKVISISSSSTDTQYPSAKCVWDNVQDVREVAEGKCKSFVLSYSTTRSSISTISQAFKPDGTQFSSFEELDTYIGSLTCLNSNFNSQSNALYGISGYIIVDKGYTGYQTYTFYKISDLVSSAKDGDVIYIIQTDVPDRWIKKTGSTIVFHKLETSKVDLTNYATKTELAGKQDTITSTNKLSASLVSGLAGVATSGSYNDLSNKPSIPTKTSDITNDSGFITKSVSDLTNYTTTTDMNAALATKANLSGGNTFTGPQTVDNKIVFTDTSNPIIQFTTGSTPYYVQAYDGKVGIGPGWDNSTKWSSNGVASFTAVPNVNGTNVALTSDIPTKTSNLTNDSGFITKSVNNLDNYTTTDSLNTALSGKENTSNKVTSVSSSSTNEQYPSALATYTAVNNEATTRSTAVSTLQTEINNLKNIGRFLALWNASTGVPTSEPTTSPYTYRTGDYFRVTVTGTRIPTGSSYVVGGTNYTTGSATAGDVFYYDGTSWNRQEVVGNYVQDVQIGSSSIVSGGVATIQTKTAYNASTNKIATESDIPDVSGKVAGPSSSTDNAVAVYNGTGGKKVKNSPIIVDSDNGELRNGTNDFRIAVASGSSEAALKIRTTGNGAYNYYVGLNTKNLTAYRRIAFPNKDGTIALTNDIPDVSSFITKDVNNLTNYTLTSSLAAVATSGEYDDLENKPTIPTVNNPTITFTQGGATKGSFTLNQSDATTIALDAGGGGGIPETTTAGQVLKSTSTAGTVQWDTLQEATYGSNDDLVIQAAQGGGGTLYMHHVEMNTIGNGLCFDVINTDSTPITTKAQIADIFTNRKMVGPIWFGYDVSAPFLDRMIVYDLPSSVSASETRIYVSAGKPGSTESFEDAYVYLENIYDTVVEI